MFEPCCNAFQPSSIFLLGRALICSSLIQLGPWDIFLDCLFPHSVRAIFGTCFSQNSFKTGQVCEISKPGSQWSTENNHGISNFHDHRGPRTLFGLALLPSYSFEILKSASIGSKEHIHGVSYFGTMSWPCLDHIEAMVGIDLFPPYHRL